MAAENPREVSNGNGNGWPLGLQIMSMRLRLQERLQAAAAVAPPAVDPYSLLHIPSSSFSSFSSSNLDTESSASFFQDNSVSLGKLIGFRAGDYRGGGGGGGGIYFQNTMIRTGRGGEESSNIRVTSTTTTTSVHAASCNCNCKDMHNRGGNSSTSVDMSQGICIPLILGALVKISRNRSKSKRLDV